MWNQLENEKSAKPEDFQQLTKLIENLGMLNLFNFFFVWMPSPWFREAKVNCIAATWRRSAKMPKSLTPIGSRDQAQNSGHSRLNMYKQERSQSHFAPPNGSTKPCLALTMMKKFPFDHRHLVWRRRSLGGERGPYRSTTFWLGLVQSRQSMGNTVDFQYFRGKKKRLRTAFWQSGSTEVMRLKSKGEEKPSNFQKKKQKHTLI